MTAYVSDPTCTDSTPFETASGTVPAIGTVALSRDLLKEFGGGPFSFGDLVAVGQTPFVEVFRVEDTMNARHTKRLDIWLPVGRRAALLFGSHSVSASLVGENSE